MRANKKDNVKKIKVVIIVTHPIQYYVPWYCSIDEHKCIDLKVIYGVLPDQYTQGEDFGVPFQWDIPITEGYNWSVIGGNVRSPGINSYRPLFNCSLYKIIKSENADIMIITGWQSSYLVQAVLIGKILNIPMLIRGEANDLKERNIIKIIIQAVFLKLFNGYLYIGDNNKKFYIARGVKKEKLFHAPYCVDSARIKVNEKYNKNNKLELRKKYGVDPKNTCFIFSGKLVPKKRPIDILKALKILTNNGHGDVEILIVGDGILNDILKNYINDNDLNVTLAGFINQKSISEVYQLADCLILPSDSEETWGLVVNEAMACKLPVIVSNQVGCVIDLVEGKNTGEIYDMGNISQLSKCMEKIIKNPKKYKKWGQNARSLIEKEYSNNILASKTVRAIESTLNKEYID